MTTRMFTVEELEDLGLPYGFNKDVSLLGTVDVEEARWGTRRLAIFEHEGTFWSVPYYDPATEMQEGMDIWEGQDPVQATEVHKELVQVERWVPSP